MAKDECFIILILITLLLDIASSLYLSKEYAVKNVGEPFIVLCKDEGGLSVIWKGPKGRLGAKTHPRVQLGSYGTSIIFNLTRPDDSGEYTCTSLGSKTSKTFSLVVEEKSATTKVSTTTETVHIPYNPKETDTLDSTTEGNVVSTSTQINNNDIVSAPEEVITPPWNRRNKYHTKKPKDNKTILETDIPPSSEDVDTNNVNSIDHPNFLTTTEEPEIIPSTVNIVDVHANNEMNNTSSKPLENFTFVDTPYRQVGVEGQPWTVRCEVNLNNVVMTWSLANGTALNASDTETFGADGYDIKNVTREHANDYTCQALHRSSGRLISRNITFIVEHKPYLTYAQENVVYGILGETVNLTCEVEANPPPKFKWRHRRIGKIIQESSYKSVLQLNMTEEVPGEYICNASNKIGTLEKIFQLGIGTKPDAPQNVTLIEAKSNSLDIFIDTSNTSTTEVDYYMEPEWIIIEYRPVGQDNVEWKQANISISVNETILENLEKNTKYEIRVAIQNKASISDYYLTVLETSLASSIHMTPPILNILVYLITLLSSKLCMA